MGKAIWSEWHGWVREDFEKVRDELVRRRVPADLIDALEDASDQGPRRSVAEKQLFETEREIRSIRECLRTMTNAGLAADDLPINLRVALPKLRRALRNETNNQLGSTLMREIIFGQVLSVELRDDFVTDKVLDLQARFPDYCQGRDFATELRSAIDNWEKPGKRWPAFLALTRRLGLGGKEPSYRKTLVRVRATALRNRELGAHVEQDREAMRELKKDLEVRAKRGRAGRKRGAKL